MSHLEQEVHRVVETPTFLFLLAALIFLYSFLFALPSIPIGYPWDDSLIYLSEGERMLRGEVMYRDFFEFLTPGTPLVYFFLFKLFGFRLWIPNLTLLLLGLGVAWLGVLVARRLMRPGLALLPSALFLAGVYKNYLDATHHWYSLLTVTAAIAVLMEQRTPVRLASAGCLCGISAGFTQSGGLVVIAAFATFLWWESWRRQEGWLVLLKKTAWLGTSFLATLIAWSAYFIGKAGLTRFLWCTVVYVFKYYPKQADLNTMMVSTRYFPALAWSSTFFLRLMGWLLVFIVIPFIYLLFFARYWREADKQPTEFWERPMLLGIVGSFMVLNAAHAPAFIRLAWSALPGLLLLGWFIDSPRKLARALAAALTVGILVVAPHAVAKFQSFPKDFVTTPRGQFAVTDREAYEEYSWVKLHTKAAEYFYEAGSPDMYFFLNLHNPTPVPFVTNNGYTTPEQVREAIGGLEQHPVRYILWSPQALDTIPNWEDPSDAHLGPLRDYVHDHYRLVNVFTNSDQVWEKKD